MSRTRAAAGDPTTDEQAQTPMPPHVRHIIVEAGQLWALTTDGRIWRNDPDPSAMNTRSSATARIWREVPGPLG